MSRGKSIPTCDCETAKRLGKIVDCSKTAKRTVYEVSVVDEDCCAFCNYSVFWFTNKSKKVKKLTEIQKDRGGLNPEHLPSYPIKHDYTPADWTKDSGQFFPEYRKRIKDEKSK
jgi:hypothetical protein